MTSAKIQSSNQQKSIESVHRRLMEVLNSHEPNWWKEKLDVSSGAIGFRWKKGGMPKTDKIIEICKLSGVSADWLLLGIGTKYIDKMHASGGEEHRRRANMYIQELEDKIEAYEEEVLDLAKKESILSAFARVGKLLNIDSDNNVDNISEEEAFQKYVLPFFIYFRSFSDIIIKMLESVFKSEKGRKFLREALYFSKDEQEKNKYLYKGRNKELDSLFKDQKIF